MAHYLQIDQIGGESYLLSDFVIGFSGPRVGDIPEEFSLQDGAFVKSNGIVFGDDRLASTSDRRVTLRPGDTLRVVTYSLTGTSTPRAWSWIVER